MQVLGACVRLVGRRVDALYEQQAGEDTAQPGAHQRE